MLDEIEHYLGPVADADPQLAIKLIHFVIDNEKNDALSILPLSTRASDCLGFSHQHFYDDKTSVRKGRMLQGQNELPPAVWIRLAYVMDTAAKSTYRVNIAGPAGWPSWFRTLVLEMVEGHIANKTYRNISMYRPIEDLQKIMKEAELPDDLLVKSVLDSEQSKYISRMHYFTGAHQIEPFSHVDKYFEAHLEVVVKHIKEAKADEKLFGLNTLAHANFDFNLILDFLVDLGTGSAKTVRDGAYRYLLPLKDKARPIIENKISNGTATEKTEAISLLSILFGKGCHEFLSRALESERSERIKQTIRKIITTPTDHDDSSMNALALPESTLKLGEIHLNTKTKSSISNLFHSLYDQILADFDQRFAQCDDKAIQNPAYAVYKLQRPSLNIDKFTEEAIEFIEGKITTRTIFANNIFRRILFNSNLLVDEWLAPPGLELIHVVRLAYVLDLIDPANEHSLHHHSKIFSTYLNRSTEKYGLREFDDCFATLPSGNAGFICSNYLLYPGNWDDIAGKPEQVWPAFVANPKVIREIFHTHGGRDPFANYLNKQRAENAFAVLDKFPVLPDDLQSLMWELALGEGKTERKQAQKVLAKIQGKTERIVTSLTDGKQVVRAAAAEWLGKLGDRTAVAPLKKAFHKEKQEVVKGAFIQALDTLGADVNEFLSRDELLKEAQAGLAKKKAKGIEIFTLSRLPELHWADTGKLVEPDITEWWINQCLQLKIQSPSPILKRYLQMCRADESTRFANHVLSTWIGADTLAMPMDEAAALAKQQADALWAQYGTGFLAEQYKGDKNNLYKQLYNELATRCLGSAIDQKGALALAAAAGNADTVRMCERYIKQWYGMRLSQCKAMIEVLAWMDNPLALQSLLGFAKRFRTKTIKQHAEELVQQIAEKHGWTVDELADRTIPDGGFARPLDENGEPIGDVAILELDYGARQFEVKLDDRLEPQIMSKVEGKILKALPAPGKDDDEAKAKEAKQLLSTAKTTVKAVVKQQEERFFDAVCTERTWHYADWRRFLAQHPIVGRLCVRLVWSAYEHAGDDEKKGAFITCFRPLEDGSLTNENDKEVKLPENAIVTIAHTCNVTPQVEAAWLKHLADYDVKPLFQQFGRLHYILPKELQDKDAITEFEGYCLSSFKLRSKAIKSGYSRGSAEDGGIFMTYYKDFSSLRIRSIIEFSGSGLPESDIQVALLKLRFTRINPQSEMSSWMQVGIPLKEIPVALLSECYNDIRQIAAEGSGFNEKWQEATPYAHTG